MPLDFDGELIIEEPFLIRFLCQFLSHLRSMLQEKKTENSLRVELKGDSCRSDGFEEAKYNLGQFHRAAK